MRIATFNVQNMRLRQDTGGPRLEGARDRDAGSPEDRRLDIIDRKLTAEIIATIDADILCLQEVFDTATLDHFHDAFLLPTGLRPYPHRMCKAGNDGYGLNVTVMARIRPDHARSHAQLTATDLGLKDPDHVLRGGPVFRRDCLEVRFGTFTLFVCHLKAPCPDQRRAAKIRGIEAKAIRRVIETSLEHPNRQFWMILGDLNTPIGPNAGRDDALAPLLDGFCVDLMARMPDGEAWTYVMSDTGQHLRPDGMLASPALAQRADDAMPRIERRGMASTAAQRADLPLSEVGSPRPHASDHAAIWIDLPDGILA
jgi:endonuclease/exonuclease/phosphatase family metal-dependent hydrolase